VRDLINLSIIWLVLVVFVLFILAVWMIFFFPEKWVEKLLIFPEKINTKLKSIILGLQSFKHEAAIIIKATILSILYQLMSIISYSLLAASVDLSIPFRYFMLFMTLIWIFSLLPISLNGLGVREGSFVYLFSSLGYPSELLSAVSVLGMFPIIVRG